MQRVVPSIVDHEGLLKTLSRKNYEHLHIDPVDLAEDQYQLPSSTTVIDHANLPRGLGYATRAGLCNSIEWIW